MAGLTRAVDAARRSAMRDLMAETGFDALVFLDPAYICYATNFHLDVAPWERPVAVVVPREGEPFGLFHELSTHHLAAAHARGSLWLEHVSLYSECPHVRRRLPLVVQWPETLARLLTAHGLARARVGADMISKPLAAAAALMPALRVVDAGHVMRQLRRVKHGEELAAIRAAATIADWAQDRYRDEIRPGRLVRELDLTVGAAVMEEAAARFPGEMFELRIYSLAGPHSATFLHGLGAPVDARIQQGNVVVTYVIPRLNGLVCENERTWFCGAPSNEQRHAFEAAREAQLAAIQALRPGNIVAATDAAAAAVFESAGLADYVLHRTGHGMGIEGHEFPEDMPLNTRELLVDEVFSAEPGIYLPQVGGFRFDDTVIVGNEPEVVTRSPKDLAAQTV